MTAHANAPDDAPDLSELIAAVRATPDDDGGICTHCGDGFDNDHGCDPTAICHHCAQELVVIFANAIESAEIATRPCQGDVDSGNIWTCDEAPCLSCVPWLQQRHEFNADKLAAAEAALAAAQADTAAMRDALNSLANEAGGIASFERDLRQAVGNTNYQCFVTRIHEADALLNPPALSHGEAK